MRVHWSFRRVPGGYIGTVHVQCNAEVVNGGGKMSYSAKGPTKATALARASVVATRAVDAIEQNPIAKALLPPGAGLALDTFKGAMKLATTGNVGEVVSHIPGLHSLARFL